MKQILLIIFSFIIIAGDLFAEDVTYWVGTSSYSDPIVRYQEALLNAIMSYVEHIDYKDTCKVENNTSHTISSADDHNQTIYGNHSFRMETVSSATHDGQETITIAIGSGPLVFMECRLELSKNDGKIENIRTFKILYEAEQEKSLHEYKIIEYGQDPKIYRSFSYNCKYESIGK